MSNPNENISASGLIDMLLRAADAWRNWRAMVTLLTAGIVTAMLFAAAGAVGFQMRSEAVGIIIATMTMLVGGVGISAAGIQLMDQAMGVPSRSIGASLFDGMICMLKWIAFLLLILVAWIAFLVMAAAMLFLCKIPGIGVVLAVVIYPVLALAATAMLVINYFLVTLVGPALWTGATLRRAIAAFSAIATKRMTAAVLSMAILIMIVGFVGVFVFGAVSGGQMLIVSLGLPILGGNFGGFGGMNPAILFMGNVNGLASAVGFGVAIIYACAFAAVTAVALLGGNYVYLHLSTGLDLSAAEDAIDAKIQAGKERAAKIQEDAKRRAAEMQEQAKRRAEDARQAEDHRQAVAVAAAAAKTNTMPVADQMPLEPSASHIVACPKCEEPTVLGDKFCGGCGQKLT